MNYQVLLADDDASIRFVLSKSLTKAGFKVRATDNAQTLMKWVKSGIGDVVLSDVHMDRDDIFSFLPEINQLRPGLPIIIMSANTSVATALKSGNAGVFDYIPKPFDLEEMRETLLRALENKPHENRPADKRLIIRNRTLNIGPQTALLGKSAAMQPVFKAVSDYMSGDIPIYIYGAVGTGKNHVAKLVHEAGNRADRPFIEFTDYEEGDDVNALREQISQGDLFVDRVHELNASQQTSLLRLLEKNEQSAPGQAFRVLSAASVAPQVLQQAGNIRDDLFYQLSGGEIALPPLLQRRGDISELANHFLTIASKGKNRSFNKAALSRLESYHWPGNVRELRGVVNMMSLKFSDQTFSPAVLDSVLVASGKVQNTDAGTPNDFDNIKTACRALLHDDEIADGATPYTIALSWVEKPLIEAALRITAGNNLRAAELLGIHRNTLRTKIKTLGVEFDK